MDDQRLKLPVKMQHTDRGSIHIPSLFDEHFPFVLKKPSDKSQRTKNRLVNTSYKMFFRKTWERAANRGSIKIIIILLHSVVAWYLRGSCL